MAISHPAALLEDERVLVNRYEFAPGDETGHHVHDRPYVIVPLTDGTLRIVEADGREAEARLTAGVPYSRPAGVSHNVVNASSDPLVFLEIEIKA